MRRVDNNGNEDDDHHNSYYHNDDHRHDAVGPWQACRSLATRGHRSAADFTIGRGFVTTETGAAETFDRLPMTATTLSAAVSWTRPVIYMHRPVIEMISSRVNSQRLIWMDPKFLIQTEDKT